MKERIPRLPRHDTLYGGAGIHLTMSWLTEQMGSEEKGTPEAIAIL